MSLVKSHEQRPHASRGLTLVELLVAVAMLLVVAALAVAGAARHIEKGRKAQTLAQFRDFQLGLTAFEIDYQKAPIPESKQWDGYDTVYGNPAGFYHNGFLVAALIGESKDFAYDGETFRVDDVNRFKQSYVQFPFKADKKAGVGPDGNLYDPWGGEIIVAVNGFKGKGFDLTDFNNGHSDRRLYTWGLAEYTDTMPRDQSYVFWSFGKDHLKGNHGASPSAVVPYAGSDDVISW